MEIVQQIPSDQGASSCRLSVIVASYRRPEPLELCLEDLAAQDTTFPFEVVVVLQAHAAGTAEGLRHRFGDRLTLQIAEFEQGLGTSRARNAGLAMARGDNVAFLDDDVRLSGQWVGRMIGFFDDPAIGGVGGYVDHPGHYTIARKAVYRALGLTSDRYRIDWGGFNVGPATHPEADQPAEWLSGGNMAFRRHAIQAVGGFDESLGDFWHEDVDVAYRVRASGWTMISSGKVAVDHYPSTINRPPLHAQMRERERSRVLFVWKAIGSAPLWQLRYGARLLLHAGAMTVIGLAKRDLRIPLGVLKGGWEGYRGLPAARAATAKRSAAHAERATEVTR
ncbi:MAG TPA: glycosyltransferase family 2 protein [Gemmatimonadaceae bacterium]|nr:glycosyltransferase family 2 protein [Gemmatimonadaceae bacterium]